MKLRIPLLLTFLTALIMLPWWFTHHYVGKYVQGQVSNWMQVVAGFTSPRYSLCANQCDNLPHNPAFILVIQLDMRPKACVTTERVV